VRAVLRKLRRVAALPLAIPRRRAAPSTSHLQPALPVACQRGPRPKGPCPVPGLGM